VSPAFVTGLQYSGTSIEILAWIGFVGLAGLVAKNTTLIVAFANQVQDAGGTPAEATVGAARRRLRLIPDDVARVHSRRGAAGGGGGDTAVAWNRGVRGAWRHQIWAEIFTPSPYTLMQRIGDGRRRAASELHEAARGREPHGRGVWPRAGD
jgi:hypothetical protein